MELPLGKKNQQGKGLSTVKTAQAMAGRLATSRHQRRKMEKLAKKYPDQFLQAGGQREEKLKR
jgi:hypothetical protein